MAYELNLHIKEVRKGLSDKQTSKTQATREEGQALSTLSTLTLFLSTIFKTPVNLSIRGSLTRTLRMSVDFFCRYLLISQILYDIQLQP